MPGEWVVTIDLGNPFAVRIGERYVTAGDCKIRIDFADRWSAQQVVDRLLAIGGVTIQQEHPVSGEVLSDPPVIMKAKAKKGRS